MAILLLIRHGENEYVKTGKLAGRLPGIHLNEVGQRQANELADALHYVPIKAIYSSPMERARETALPIVSILGLELQIHDDLIETGIGEWSGQELKILRKRPEWKDVQSCPSRFRFPGGESFFECQLRIVNAVESIVKKYQDNDIIACVSHADPIKLVIAYFLGMPLDHFQRLGCDPASLTILSLSSKGAFLMKINQIPPLSFQVPGKK